MVRRTFELRRIEGTDREETDRRIRAADALGDLEWAETLQDSFARWEREQGRTEQRLACAVCGTTWLRPTRRGLARPHVRSGSEELIWEMVGHLRLRSRPVTPRSAARTGPDP